MEELLKAIREALERKGLSEAAASRMAVGNPSAIKNLRVRRGSTRSHPIENLVRVAEVLDLELYLGPPRPEIDPDKQDYAEFAYIPRYDVRVSAGPGSLNDNEPLAGEVAFRRDWLARHGLRPSSICAVTVHGDSMEPTLLDGDIALLSSDETVPDHDRIYVFVLPDGEAVVKRAIFAPGALHLVSDNRTHPTRVLAGDDLVRTRVVGRVVWFGRNVPGNGRSHHGQMESHKRWDDLLSGAAGG